jgi:hypothetical protein
LVNWFACSCFMTTVSCCIPNGLFLNHIILGRPHFWACCIFFCRGLYR